MSKQKIVPPYLDSVGRYVGMASGATSDVANGLLAKYGMTLQHWVVLTALWRQEGLSVSDIAGYYGVNAPAASRIIGRMGAAGWVTTKIDSDDKRAAKIFLTDKARAHSHLLNFYQDVNDIMLKGFTAAEIAQLKDMLTRIAKNGPQRDRGPRASVND